MICDRQMQGTVSNSLDHQQGEQSIPEHDISRTREYMESAVTRQLAFWAIICLAGGYLLGWPLILTWFGIAWGMRFFLVLMFGESSPGGDGQTHKSHHRCPRLGHRDGLPPASPNRGQTRPS